MRRILLLLGITALLAIPTLASAHWLRGSTNDGTLVVRNGYGSVVINGGKDANGNTLGATGALIGSLYNGTVTLTDPAERDTEDLQVAGCEFKRLVKENSLLCTGTKIRYRVVGGKFKMKVQGSDIDLSAVGQGWATLKSDGPVDTDGDGVPDVSGGDYKLNDGDWAKLPEKATSYRLQG